MKNLTFLFVLFVTVLSEIFAQNPTITATSTILCPNEDVTLSTQIFDTYQWYRNNVALENANEQTLTLDFYNSAGSVFKVEVTLDGQTAMSPELLIDGYAFIPIYYSITGDYIYEDEAYYLCDENDMNGHDTVTFEIQSGYNTNIQWFNNGEIIEGANSQIFHATKTGVYHAQASPEICPLYSENTLPAMVIEIETTVPEIVEEGNQLKVEAAEEYDIFQWYLNELIIQGATQPAYEPTHSGEYKVFAANMCALFSEPYDFQLLGINPVTNKGLFVYPNPATNRFQINLQEENIKNVEIYTNTGMLFQQFVFGTNSKMAEIETTSWQRGIYFVVIKTDRGIFSEKLIVQ